jgi:hypothetical protein
LRVGEDRPDERLDVVEAFGPAELGDHDAGG